MKSRVKRDMMNKLLGHVGHLEPYQNTHAHTHDPEVGHGVQHLDVSDRTEVEALQKEQGMTSLSLPPPPGQ